MESAGFHASPPQAQSRSAWLICATSSPLISRRPREAGANIRKSRPLAGLSLLEIGCGGGILCEPLARLGAAIVGIDPAPGNIEIARKHAEADRLAIDYRATTAEELAATGAQFDAVLAMEVVEHVTDLRSFVKTTCSLVRPSGLVFAATLNRTLKSFALAIVGAEYVLRWLPKGTHQWEKFVTPEELAKALYAGGVEISGRTGVVYRPLIDEWRASSDMAVNYMVVGERRDREARIYLTARRSCRGHLVTNL